MIVNRDPGDEHTTRNEPVAVNSKLERPFELPPAAVSETEPERAGSVTGLRCGSWWRAMAPIC
jgi:hypothetical protein